MDGWVLVYALGAGQGTLLALALWQRRTESPGSGLLSVWIALASVDLAVRALYLADPGPELLKPWRVVALFPFLHGSLFYLYTRALTRGSRLRWRDGLHFAGFALALLAWIDLLLLGPADTAALYGELAVGRIPARARWIDLAMMAYCLSYVALALRELLRYRRRLLDRRSDGDPGALRWLYAMALSQVLIWLIAVGQWLTSVPWLSYRLIYAGVAAWVFLVGYLSLVRPRMPALEADPVPAASDSGEQPGPGAGAEDPRSEAVAARLQALMDQGAYSEPALTIGQLARRSGYPEYLVSAVINRRHGCHFWDYVNGHRVEAARACLSDPDDPRTVLEIAYAVGFTAKSTFNAAFKRRLGETPGDYRRRCAADRATAVRTRPG